MSNLRMKIMVKIFLAAYKNLLCNFKYLQFFGLHSLPLKRLSVAAPPMYIY